VGFWQSADELRAHASVARQWQPQMAGRTRAALYAKWKKAVTRSFNWTD
jgi:glycerol kinase